MKAKKKKPVKMDIALRLAKIRNEAPAILGIPFEEILKRCGISEKFYLACEQGKRRLRANHMQSLSIECKLNVNWLLGRGEVMFLEDLVFIPRFKEFRETAPGILGITFNEILQKCGIPEEDYRIYEAGMKNPPIEYLYLLLREFNLNINWLYGHKSSMFLKKEDIPCDD
jgi:transcriptional regulator with XRE-family HTH domain